MEKLAEKQCLLLIIDAIPQWYIADCGPYIHRLTVNKVTQHFYTQHPLTERLQSFQNAVESNLPRWLNEVTALDIDVGTEHIQMQLALLWLDLHSKHINWKKLYHYFKHAQSRSYENMPVINNLVISEGAGTDDITDPEIAKIIDPLARSLFTYFKVNQDLLLSNYKQVNWSSIATARRYKLYPEFLHAFYSVIPDGDFSAHLTTKGDWVILNNKTHRINKNNVSADEKCSEYDLGLILTRRKGKISLYDSPNLKNNIYRILKKTSKNAKQISNNLFEILLDLSFMRHGALLIYDPDDKLLEHVVNPLAIIKQGFHLNAEIPRSAQSILGQYINNISLSDKERDESKKRVLLEIAGIDGAVIFNDTGITAFGAMVNQHPNANRETGARSTAAYSAFLYGAHPFKISSDGNITIYFLSKEKRGKKQQCFARIDFT